MLLPGTISPILYTSILAVCMESATVTFDHSHIILRSSITFPCFFVTISRNILLYYVLVMHSRITILLSSRIILLYYVLYYVEAVFPLLFPLYLVLYLVVLLSSIT